MEGLEIKLEAWGGNPWPGGNADAVLNTGMDLERVRPSMKALGKRKAVVAEFEEVSLSLSDHLPCYVSLTEHRLI